MMRGLQVVIDTLPKKATPEQRLKKGGVMWTLGARWFQVEGTEHAKAMS